MEKEHDIRGYGIEKISASVLSYYGAGEEVLCQMTGKKISKAACLELGRVHRQNQRFCTGSNCESPYRLRLECILRGLPEAEILFADFEKYAFFSTENGDGDKTEDDQQPKRKNLVLKSSSSQKNSHSYSQQEEKFWCPEYQEEISRERCLNNCSHLQKNRQACSALNCPSLYRLCLVCAELKPAGFSFLKNPKAAKKCAIISPTVPYCKIHSNNRKKIPDFFINQNTGNPKPVKKERGKKVDEKFKKMPHFDRIEFIQKLLSENNGSFSAVANKLGVSDELVGFYNTANKASSEIKDLLMAGKINFTALVRLAVESPQTQKELAEKIIAVGLKGKAAVAFINKTVGPAKRHRKESAPKIPKPPAVAKKKRGPYKKKPIPPAASAIISQPAPLASPPASPPTLENLRKTAVLFREATIAFLSDIVKMVTSDGMSVDESADGSIIISTESLVLTITAKSK